MSEPRDEDLLLLRLVMAASLALKIGKKELAAHMHEAAAGTVLDIARRQPGKRLPRALIDEVACIGQRRAREAGSRL